MIGDSISSFGDQLPSGLDVVRLYFYSNRLHDEKITWVVKSIQGVWDRAEIPTRAESSIRLKVKNLITCIKSILNTRHRSTMFQVDKENNFLAKNGSLFDVVDQVAVRNLGEKKLQFLNDQRNSRIQTISDMNLNSVDVFLSEDSIEMCSNDDDDGNDDDDNDDDDSEYDDSDDDFDPSSSDDEPQTHKKKLKLATIEKMDQARLSFRQMHEVAKAFIEEFDHDPCNYCIGISTFHSKATKIRSHRNETSLNNRMKNSDVSSKVVVLFDSKTCHQINAAHLPKEKRLAIVLHSNQLHIGLEISTIPNGSADSISDVLQSSIIKHNLSARIIGLVCDTENTNTGFLGGACAKLENKIIKELLRLCCRHHIMEILLKKVCEKIVGKNSAPHFSFQDSDRIKDQWKNIDKNDYHPLESEDFQRSHILSTLKDQAIIQIQNDSRNPSIRDDYAELNDICLKLLDVRTNKRIRVIGALSKARWIAKALLIGKMFLLRQQLNLEDQLVDKLKRICIFVCCLYVKYWNRSPNVFNAPSNDLSFMRELHLYKAYDEEIAQTAIDTFADHLTYLGGELVVLSLFSSTVQPETKNRLRRRIQSNVTKRDQSSVKFTIDPNTDFMSLNLEDFVTTRSYFLFQLIEIAPDFLQQDAFTWEYVASYTNIKDMIEKSITVINDGAERMLGVADSIIKSQRARKENYFQNLTFAKFDKHRKSL